MKEKSKDPVLRAVFKCIFSVFKPSPSHPTCGLSGPESSCTGFLCSFGGSSTHAPYPWENN
uniref:Uncharacterized protein n=1 Tax=Lepeophtheirus salmonis TaxID=72036 RepID=A0A0K2VFI5_LEPSM